MRGIVPSACTGDIIEWSSGLSDASDSDVRHIHGRLLLVLQVDASEDRAVRFRLAAAIFGLQRSRGGGASPLFSPRTRQRNARSNAGWRVAQGIRGMAGLAPRAAKARLARAHRQHASNALDGALCVRIYRATPLQPSGS